MCANCDPKPSIESLERPLVICLDSGQSCQNASEASGTVPIVDSHIKGQQQPSLGAKDKTSHAD